MTYPERTNIETARTSTSPERLRMLARLHEREVKDALRANVNLPMDVLVDLPRMSAWDDADRW